MYLPNLIYKNFGSNCLHTIFYSVGGVGGGGSQKLSKQFTSSNFWIRRLRAVFLHSAGCKRVHNKLRLNRTVSVSDKSVKS